MIIQPGSTYDDDDEEEDAGMDEEGKSLKGIFHSADPIGVILDIII